MVKFQGRGEVIRDFIQELNLVGVYRNGRKGNSKVF